MRVRRVALGTLASAVLVGGIGVSSPATLADELDVVGPSARVDLTVDVRGTYIPIAGAFDCDDGSDDPEGDHSTEQPGILWYAPGTAADSLWTDLAAVDGHLQRTRQTLSINGTYIPLVGDFDGDLCSDILWYGPGTAADVLWWGGPAGFTKGTPIAVNGVYRPTTGFLGGPGSGILWYAPNGAESIWRPTGNRSAPFVTRSMPQVSGTGYQPVMFSDPWTGQPQVLWYAPGPAGDSIWKLNHSASGVTIASSFGVSITQTYRIGNCERNVLLHGPGTQGDRSLTTNGNTAVVSDFTISGSFRVASTRGTRLCTTIWHAPGPALDQIWLQQF